MPWNNGYERKKFDKKQKKQAERYRKLGMDESQIQEMYEFDLALFNSDRAYRTNTKSLEQILDEDQETPERQTNKKKKELRALTVFPEDRLRSTFDWWLDEIDDPILLQNLRSLSPKELETLTYSVFYNWTQAELSRHFGIAQQNISMRLKRISKKISKNL